MTLVLGVAGIAAGLLSLFGAIVAYRRPDAPRWTHSDTIVYMILIPIIAFLTFGVAQIVAFLFSAGEGFGAVEAGLIAAIVAVTALAARAMPVRRALAYVPEREPIGAVKPRNWSNPVASHVMGDGNPPVAPRGGKRAA